MTPPSTGVSSSYLETQVRQSWPGALLLGFECFEMFCSGLETYGMSLGFAHSFIHSLFGGGGHQLYARPCVQLSGNTFLSSAFCSEDGAVDR